MLLALALALAASAQTLTFDGVCPGEVEVAITGMTPGGDLAVLSGGGTGSDAIPGGPCAGTATSLAGLRLTTIVRASPDGSVSARPRISGGGCANPIQVVDLTTCAISPVAYPLLAADAEGCDAPALDQSWRSVDFNDGNGGVEECDMGAAGGDGWYRFVGEGGSRMPEEPQLEYDCGTDAPGWLDGAHPTGWGETASVRTCYRWSGDDCNWSNDIRITNCGQFYAYELVTPPVSCLAYCTTL